MTPRKPAVVERAWNQVELGRDDNPASPEVLTLAGGLLTAYEAEHELLGVILKECPTLIVCYWKGRDLKERTKEALANVDKLKGTTK